MGTKTKEIDIVYEGKKEKAIIRRMGWAEKNSFSERYVDIQVVGDNTVIKTHTFESRTGALLKCLVNAPFIDPAKPLDIQDLDILDPKMLEKIYKEIDKLNSFGEDEKKNSSKSSGNPEKNP